MATHFPLESLLTLRTRIFFKQSGTLSLPWTLFFSFTLVCLSSLPVYAANECGTTTAGGTVTCNNDGAPATDTGPYMSGIRYTIPVNLIVDGTTNPIISYGRIGVNSTASVAQNTTIIGDVDIIMTDPAAGAANFAVGDYTSGASVRDMGITLGDGVDITINQNVAGRSTLAVAAYTTNSNVFVNSDANITMTQNSNGVATAGMYVRGYSLVTLGTNSTLNANIGGDINIYTNGGNSIAGILVDAGTSSPSLMTVNSTANVDITSDGALNSVAQGISVQNNGAGGLYLHSTGTVDVHVGQNAGFYGISGISQNALGTIIVDGAVSISGNGLGRAVYGSGNTLMYINADVTAYSGTSNIIGVQALGTDSTIHIADGVNIKTSNEVFSAYGIYVNGSNSNVIRIGENATIEAATATSTAFGIFGGTTAGSYDIHVGSGAVIRGVAQSPDSAPKAGTAIQLNNVANGGTMILEQGAIIEGKSEGGAQSYSLALSNNGNDIVTSYATLIGDVWANGGNDVINLLGGSLTGAANMGDGDDTLHIANMGEAALSSITHLDGGNGEDALTFTNINYRGGTFAIDDPSQGINLMSGWETINFVNSTWTLTGNLVLGGSTINIDPNSVLYAGGVNSVIESSIPGDPAIVNNSGIIDLTNNGSMTGDTLVIRGNYISNGGVILMNAIADGSIMDSDTLIIDGSNGGGTITGTSVIKIANVNQLGQETTGNGILLVQTVNGATTNADDFVVSRISSGAYNYALQMNAADNNWYLVSLPGVRSEIIGALALPDLSQRLVLTMLGRMDEHQTDKNSKVWVRSFGQLGEVGKTGNFAAHGPAYDYKMAGGQIGMDLIRTPDIEKTQDAIGVYAASGHVKADMSSPVNGTDAGTSQMTAYGLGAYWTHKAAQGWYIDTVAQATLYDNIRSVSNSGEALSTRGHGYLASVEGGQNYKLENDMTFTPQAQLIVQKTKLNNTEDSFGRMEFRDADAVYTRIGAKLNKTIHLENGPIDAWVMPSFTQSFGADAKTIATNATGGNGAAFTTDLGGSSVSFDVGVSGKISQAVSFYTAAEYSTSLNRPGNAIAGKVGLKINW